MIYSYEAENHSSGRRKSESGGKSYNIFLTGNNALNKSNTKMVKGYLESVLRKWIYSKNLPNVVDISVTYKKSRTREEPPKATLHFKSRTDLISGFEELKELILSGDYLGGLKNYKNYDPGFFNFSEKDRGDVIDLARIMAEEEAERLSLKNMKYDETGDDDTTVIVENESGMNTS